MSDGGSARKTHISEPPVDEATHSPDGVDLTLVRWMLSLSPEERLEVLQENVRSILSLRDLRAGLTTGHITARRLRPGRA